MTTKEMLFRWTCLLCDHVEVGPETSIRRYCRCGNYMVKGAPTKKEQA